MSDVYRSVRRSPHRECRTPTSKENLTPLRKVQLSGSTRSPLTPVQNLVSNIRQKLEHHLESKPETNQEAHEDESTTPTTCKPGKAVKSAVTAALPSNISPGLAMLRNTPAHKGLKFKRHVLETKHQETRNKADRLCVGGGVSLWPDMQNMRLTQAQTLMLIVCNLLLIPVTIWIFYKVHGEVVFDLLEYTDKLRAFVLENRIDVNAEETDFRKSILTWHNELTQLMGEIHDRFDVPWNRVSSTYVLSVFLYVVGIATLLFFLVDNVVSKNKLSPRRIQSWVSLLTVTALWTLLSLKLLVLAQRLEQTAQDTVYDLNRYLGEALSVSHDVSVLERVLLYWSTCCLPPHSRGVLRVMGLVAIQDVIAYLQYYSLPVLTALLSPVLKLVVSLKQIYCPAVAPLAVK